MKKEEETKKSSIALPPDERVWPLKPEVMLARGKVDLQGELIYLLLFLSALVIWAAMRVSVFCILVMISDQAHSDVFFHRINMPFHNFQRNYFAPSS